MNNNNMNDSASPAADAAPSPTAPESEQRTASEAPVADAGHSSERGKQRGPEVIDGEEAPTHHSAVGARHELGNDDPGRMKSEATRAAAARKQTSRPEHVPDDEGPSPLPGAVHCGGSAAMAHKQSIRPEQVPDDDGPSPLPGAVRCGGNDSSRAGKKVRESAARIVRIRRNLSLPPTPSPPLSPILALEDTAGSKERRSAVPAPPFNVRDTATSVDAVAEGQVRSYIPESEVLVASVRAANATGGSGRVDGRGDDAMPIPSTKSARTNESRRKYVKIGICIFCVIAIAGIVIGAVLTMMNRDGDENSTPAVQTPAPVKEVCQSLPSQQSPGEEKLLCVGTAGADCNSDASACTCAMYVRLEGTDDILKEDVCASCEVCQAGGADVHGFDCTNIGLGSRGCSEQPAQRHLRR